MIHDNAGIPQPLICCLQLAARACFRGSHCRLWVRRRNALLACGKVYQYISCAHTPCHPSHQFVRRPHIKHPQQCRCCTNLRPHSSSAHAFRILSCMSGEWLETQQQSLHGNGAPIRCFVDHIKYRPGLLPS